MKSGFRLVLSRLLTLFIWLYVPACCAQRQPSEVTVSGRQLLVKKRNADGTLGAQTKWVIKGVTYSPAGRNTATSSADSQNVNVRRSEFARWVKTDAALLKAMNVNTVRLYLDPGFDSAALATLDELYRNGIMVILTVDDAINDMARIQKAIPFYRDHPAILFWSLGNEWNVNETGGVLHPYYGNSNCATVPAAAQCTQNAAHLIKSLDPNHPVATIYGDPNIAGNLGRTLADTKTYVDLCTDVDVWGFNIFRGATFTDLFSQWKSISTKPMFISEYGTDAYDNSRGRRDEAMQALWDLRLWHEIVANLSAADAQNAGLGGTVFEWNDEYWKGPDFTAMVPAAGYTGPHPDGFANEDVFGLVDVDRKPRQVFYALQSAYRGDYAPAAFTRGVSALSGGALAPPPEGNRSALSVDRTILGGDSRNRGFTIIAVDPVTLATVRGPATFDTYADSTVNGAAMIALIDSIPAGSLVMIAVGDEAGLAYYAPDPCAVRVEMPGVKAIVEKLEQLGSKKIRSYCYQNSWAMISVKGEAAAIDEKLGAGPLRSDGLGSDVVWAYLPIPRQPPPPLIPCAFSVTGDAASFAGAGGTGALVVTSTSQDCAYTATANASWMTIVPPVVPAGTLPYAATLKGYGSGRIQFNVAASAVNRTGTITVSGQTVSVTQTAATCSYALPASGQSADVTGFLGSVAVSTQSGCVWGASTQASWIRILSGSTVTGEGSASYLADANPSYQTRSAIITAAGLAFTVTQTGLPCTYSLSAYSAAMVSSGGAGSVGVTTQPGCVWSAGGNNWIAITSGASGTGSGTITYSVASNPGADRAGALTIGGQTYTITQAGEAPNYYPDNGSLTPFTGSGLTQTFTATFTDANGGGDIATANLLINVVNAVTNACAVQYRSAANGFYLLNDAGTSYLGPLTTLLENGQCQVRAAGTSAAVSGNTLTLNVALTFKAVFGGPRPMYLSAQDAGGKDTGWSPFGTWWPNGGTPQLVSRYRLYVPWIRSHHYTTDLNEYNTLGVGGMAKEGSTGSMYDRPATVNGIEATPLYRIYLPGNGDHFWTTDRNEYLTLIKNRAFYSGEGIDGFLFGGQVSNSKPLYRLNYIYASPPIHHWTTDQFEYDSLRNGGAWVSEGITGYLLP